MNSFEKKMFGEVFAGVCEMYGKTASPQFLEIYFRALDGYELDDVRKAFESHLRNPDCGQYFPKPADVIRQIDGDGNTKSLDAWNKFFETVRNHGSYASVVFDDPRIHAVINDMGGWVYLCSQLDEKNRSFLCNEFCRRYSAYLQKTDFDYPEKLVGFIEQQNTLKGVVHIDVKQIGLGDLHKTNGNRETLSDQQSGNTFLRRVKK